MILLNSNKPGYPLMLHVLAVSIFYKIHGLVQCKNVGTHSDSAVVEFEGYVG